MMDRKPILCLDFDGVCHSYASGWKGADVIPDPHVPGLFEFLEAAKEHFDIQVFSSRSGQPGGCDAMALWFARERKAWRDAGGRPPVDTPLEISFPKEKPPAVVSIDDRALTFTGAWPSVEMLRAFQPWNKRPPPNRDESAPDLLARLGMDAEKWCAEMVNCGIVQADPTAGEMFHAWMCNAIMAGYDRGAVVGEKRERERSWWQPIETAPKDESSILITIAMPIGWGYLHPARWDIERGGWMPWSYDGEVISPEFAPTHWQPLPSPPPGESDG